ncbi:MAG: hypothetical protein Kow0029_06090 [Candidatus Rifleibacteriota bacterium]
MLNLSKLKGVTIIELLVALLVMGLISTAVYSLLSNARYSAALTAARGAAKQEAQIIMRYLERDISNSRAKLVEEDGKRKVVKTLEILDNGATMEVFQGGSESLSTHFDNDDASEDSNYQKVDYQLDGTRLYRTQGTKHLLSANVKEFAVEENYDGKVNVKLVVEKKLSGFKGTVEHVERTAITVREAEQTEVDKRWRQRVTSGGSFDY